MFQKNLPWFAHKDSDHLHFMQNPLRDAMKKGDNSKNNAQYLPCQKRGLTKSTGKEKRGNRMNLQEKCRADCISILPTDKFEAKLSKKK